MSKPRKRVPVKAPRIGILIVDDEPDMLEALRLALAAALPEVEVHTARSGAAGLALLARQPVELIVTDFKMPVMNGLEFLDAARRVAPRTPRIMMSAYPDPALVEQAVRDLGVSLFIGKPFDLDYFVATIRGLLVQ
ncbi:MAG: response regulator [Thermoplasmatota archaeon]